ncbi:MAG: hypothetical protein C6W55_16035 [Thermobacillus sp.]|jgi:sugar/nucleoside kinase (ribokinase family)|uniref:PfkB family carbohydrate kinase n=1 Tax=Thermobacillus TaxID=76632 RepID=UPI00022C2E26|nr:MULTISPECIES: PfkB family carbohydrate kinase [Thermobacillus]REK52490.1 MAG: hypothetical protein C6W55_16035 [Thermobacillus sp.]
MEKQDAAPAVAVVGSLNMDVVVSADRMPKPVVDTTGAGDAAGAAFACALAAGRPLDACCAFAVRAASRSVMTFGAQAGMPRLAELGTDAP